MKKVLSVLLAAAMVMGMSVSAFAANHKWAANSDDHNVGNVNTVEFGETAYVVRNGAVAKSYAAGTEMSLQPGDDIYFELMEVGASYYEKAIDADWSINIKGNEFVEKASFYSVPKFDADKEQKTPWGLVVTKDFEGRAYVKVEVVDDLDTTSLTSEVKFNMYLADNQYDTKSNTVTVVAKFANIGEYPVDFDFTNDVDEAGIWKVAKDKKGTAVFDFEDEAYVTVKMISEEKVVLNLSVAYDKAIDKEYNEYDADLSFYNFKGTKDAFTKTAELLIPAKEATYIYEIVDGELVEVEAEYVEEYKLEGTNRKYAGWLIETKELGYYVVADEELVVAEEEVEAKPEVEADKANPETGAADFVGAAVAMAVVSVAAAGALALKK